MQWDLFTILYDLLATPLIAGVDAMIGSLTSWARAVLIAGLVVTISVSLLLKAVRPATEPLSDLTMMLLHGALAVFIAGSAANFGTYVRDVLLTTIPQEIGTALAGPLGGRPITGTFFGELWSRAWLSGLAAYRALPWTVAGIAFSLVVVLYWLIAAAAIAYTFFVWMKAFVFIALLVGLGPAFLALFVFPWFRGFAQGWFNTVAANVILQILVVGLLSLFMTAETELLRQIAAETRNGNEIVAVQYLFAGIVLLGGVAWLTFQLHGASNAIGHGFTGYGRRLGNRLSGHLARGEPARDTAPSAAPAPPAPPPAAPAASLPPIRLLPPPGPSLSNS